MNHEPLLALVHARPGGEDADFRFRFHENRVRRWVRGVRNGLHLGDLLRYRFLSGDILRFRGRPIAATDMSVTCRLVEDIIMRGEYDLPGFVPRKGWRVVDIGANVGIFTLLAASRGATVTSVEAAIETFDRLVRNTEGLEVECHHRAVVGTGAGRVLFDVSGRDTRHHVVDAEASSGLAVEVPAAALGDVLREECDLLKIDCEGAEFGILLGCSDEVVRRARRMVVEVHGDMGDVDSLCRRVEQAGFRVRLHPAYPGTSFQLLTAERIG